MNHKNTLRTSDYMSIRRCINSCQSYHELCGMDFLVYNFAAKGTDEGRDLIQELLNKKTQLKPEVK